MLPDLNKIKRKSNLESCKRAILFDEMKYEEPECLICDDTEIIEYPESGKTYICRYCNVYNHMIHDEKIKEEL